MNTRNRLTLQNWIASAFDPVTRVRTAFTGFAGCKALAYHRIARLPERDDPNCIAVTPEQFRAQLRQLRESGFRTISTARLFESFAGGPILPELALLITFDDGFRDLYDTALPILQEYGFTASVFLIADRVGTDPTRFLGHEEIADLKQCGWEFGSHSRTHRDLTSLSHKEAVREIVESKAILQERFGDPVNSFCYPFGRTTPALTDAVRDAGYRLAFGTDPGVVRATDDRFQIKRIEVNALDTATTFTRKLSGGYNWAAPYRSLKQTARRRIGRA